MKEVRVKLTSKNQITLPVKIVRDMGLDKNRYITIKRRGASLLLSAEESFDERMKLIWAEAAKYIKRPQTDEEIKQAIREIGARRGAK